MGAKAIINRYMDRNQGSLPDNKEELRQHIVAVASEANLELTDQDLEALAPLPATVTERTEKDKKGKTGDLKASAEKSGNTTTGEI